MIREERIVRDGLAALASDARGRRLLQLALRGIQESGRGLTTGCWVERGGGFDALEKRRFRRFHRTGRLGLPGGGSTRTPGVPRSSGC